MGDTAISVNPAGADALTFDVAVRDTLGATRHRVTLSAGEASRWAKLGAAPSQCVEAAMRFLLDREPKDSILGAFDMRVIRGYFPDFDDAFPGYLARLSGAPGRGA